MALSLFDIIGPVMIGPSSSHTAGAARIGFEAYRKLKNLPEKIEITLYNSFADTQVGHGTVRAILAGCMGISWYDVRLKKAEAIARENKIIFKVKNEHYVKYHPNTAAVVLKYKDNQVALIGASLGGGRIAVYDSASKLSSDYSREIRSIRKINERDPFFSFSSYIKKSNNDPDDLIDLVIRRERLMNEKTVAATSRDMFQAWSVMKQGIEENIKNKEKLFKGLCGGDAFKFNDSRGGQLLSPITKDAMAYALAIGERNAGMGCIVAAPTAGSAGIVPGVLYSLWKNQKLPEEKIIKALFVAGALGLVIANRATLAGSEGGCQAECGAATAMAAGAVAYLHGASIDYIDNAASIALSNALGLVCDPISGMVAVPCIHRNALSASVALSAASMALAGIDFVVRFDEVVDTLRKIGEKIPVQLKETSRGGLAVTKTGLRYNKILLSREHI